MVVTILTILILYILLPTLDTFTDINLAKKLYVGANYYFATSMLLPFLVNYVACLYTYIRRERYKKYTFIFPLINLYPQYEACKLIYSIYKDPVKGKNEKREYDKNIGLHEPFLESVPSALVITVIAVTALLGRDASLNIIFNEDNFNEFAITYIISVISAALGLAKCLKNGVARPIGDGGWLDGLLSIRHLLVFLASGMTLGLRGTCLGLLAGERGWESATMPPSDMFLTITLLFLPQSLLSIFSTLDLGSRNSLKIITRHPSLILLPIFTFFTFSKLRVGCCAQKSKVQFSKRFTWLNIGVSTAGCVSWIFWFYFRFEFGNKSNQDFYIHYLPPTISPLVLSIILTILFLHLDRVCCSCSLVPGEHLHVYDPDVPEDDVETANQSVDDLTTILTVSEVQKIETHQLVEDIIEDLIRDVLIYENIKEIQSSLGTFRQK